MNKSKKISACILVIIMKLSYTYADNLSVSGSATLNSQDYQSVSVSGNLTANKITTSKTLSVSGNATINNSIIAQLSVSGNTRLDTSKVNGQIDISGNATIMHSNISVGKLSCSGNVTSQYSTYDIPMDISGNLTSDHDKFNGEVTTSGNILAYNDTFRKSITTSANTLELNNSTLYGKIINTNDNHNPPTIILKNANVRDKIIFTKTSGIVILYGNSKVTAKVENGQIEYRK